MAHFLVLFFYDGLTIALGNFYDARNERGLFGGIGETFAKTRREKLIHLTGNSSELSLFWSIFQAFIRGFLSNIAYIVRNYMTNGRTSFVRNPNA